MGLASKKCKSSDSLIIPTQQLVFEVDTTKKFELHLLTYTSNMLEPASSQYYHIKSIAEFEGVTTITTKTILCASLCLQLIANEDKDTGTIEVCKEIVEKGTYRKDNTILLERNSSFLFNSLYIGKQKYRELRRFLTSIYNFL